MRFVRKSLFAKFMIGVVTTAFCLNGSGIAFAADNLRQISAAKDDLPDIENELIRTHSSLDGGTLSRADIVHIKANLGANAILPVSATAVRLAAAAHRMPVYQYIAQYLGNRKDRKNFTYADYLEALQTVYPEMNIMNGGAHAGWVTDIQEFMILVGLRVRMPFWKRMEMANKVVASLTEIYKSPELLTEILGRKVKKPFSTLVGDEGGYAPDLKGNEEGFKLIVAAIKRAGLEEEVGMSIDAAISDLYDEDAQTYNLRSEKRVLSREKWVGQLKEWFDEYKVVAAEDVFAENDHEGWRQGFKIVGKTMIIVGDDSTVTNLKLLKNAIAENAEEINTILIKINQNGSISGTLEVIQYALAHGISVAISHRSGETEDDLIKDIAIAANLFVKKPHPKTGLMPIVMLKTGGFRRTDRIVKYNGFLTDEAEIEQYLAQGILKPAQRMALSAELLDNPRLAATVITGVRAVEIYDSRGNPTVKAILRLNNGLEISNTVPSGASTGTRESVELRDGVVVKNKPHWITQELVNRIMPGMTIEQAKKELADRVGGKGVLIAVDNVNYKINPLIKAAQVDVANINSLKDLRKFDGIMFSLEVLLAGKEAKRVKAAQDGGETFTFVGGTGAMGKSLAERALAGGNEVLIGSRRANPSRNIYENKDAVQKGRVVFFTVSGKEKTREIKRPDGTVEKVTIDNPLRDSVIDLAKNLQDNTVVVSVATAFEPNKDGKLTYLPPAKSWDDNGNVLERYTSSAEATQEWIAANTRAKGVQVVQWSNSLFPAEQMSNPKIRLKLSIAVAGDRAVCDLNRIKRIFESMNLDVEPEYIGGLEKSCYIEALTPKIIVGKKELILALQEGLMTVREAAAFLEKHGVDYDNKEFTEFVRTKLDPYLMNKYSGHPLTLMKDVNSVNDRKTSIEERELTFVGLRRYAEITMENDKDLKKTLLKAVKSFSVETVDTNLNSVLPGNVNKIIEVLSKYATKYGALVFKADTILRNAGSVAFLRAIKEAGLPVRVIVWTDDPDQAAALELMGVDEVATIKQTSLENVFSELKDDKGVLIAAEQTVAIGFEKTGELPASAQGVTVFNLETPQLAKKGISFINAMSLIISKSLVIIFKNEEVIKTNEEVAQAYEEVSTSYFKSEKININEQQLSQFNDFTGDFFEIPLVKVEEEVAKSQIAYDAIVKDL